MFLGLQCELMHSHKHIAFHLMGNHIITMLCLAKLESAKLQPFMIKNKTILVLELVNL